MNLQLEGKRALVSGSTAAIGLATARSALSPFEATSNVVRAIS
jgi:NAD(P)-dependent dehydrogenase (short-subunit alcohol dehydrogenase family)